MGSLPLGTGRALPGPHCPARSQAHRKVDSAHDGLCGHRSANTGRNCPVITRLLGTITPWHYRGRVGTGAARGRGTKVHASPEPGRGTGNASQGSWELGTLADTLHRGEGVLRLPCSTFLLRGVVCTPAGGALGPQLVPAAVVPDPTPSQCSCGPCLPSAPGLGLVLNHWSATEGRPAHSVPGLDRSLQTEGASGAAGELHGPQSCPCLRSLSEHGLRVRHLLRLRWDRAGRCPKDAQDPRD